MDPRLRSTGRGLGSKRVRPPSSTLALAQPQLQNRRASSSSAPVSSGRLEQHAAALRHSFYSTPARQAPCPVPMFGSGAGLLPLRSLFIATPSSIDTLESDLCMLGVRQDGLPLP